MLDTSLMYVYLLTDYDLKTNYSQHLAKLYRKTSQIQTATREALQEVKLEG